MAAALRADAHEMRPGFLELRETGRASTASSGRSRRAARSRSQIAPIDPAGLPADHARPAADHAGRASSSAGTLRCDGGLAGKTLAIDGLESTITDVLVRIHHADGRLESHLLQPASPSVTLGAHTTAWQRSGAYLRLGVEHILLGVDHLLFVLGLLLIVADRWMLVKTITSFTLAHSITLAIATLGYASAPCPPLNAAIALSILFLGPEIVRTVARARRASRSATPGSSRSRSGCSTASASRAASPPWGCRRPRSRWRSCCSTSASRSVRSSFVLLVIVLLERSFRVLEIRWPRLVERAARATPWDRSGAYWTIQRTLILLAGLR